MDRFKGELYNIKKKYAELEMSRNENFKKIKYDKEMIDRRAELNSLKTECYKLDQQCMIKQKQLMKLRNDNYERAQEKKFLDEQIKNAKTNQERLLMNVNMLNQEDLSGIAAEADEKSLEVSNMLGMTEINGEGEDENIPKAITYDEN